MAKQWRRIGPEDVAHCSFLWRLDESINFLDVLCSDAVFTRKAAVTDHNFFVEDIGKWKRTEELRESFIDPNILVLCLNFSLKPVNMVHLLGLMISSSHMQEVFIGALPSNEREHALDRERTSIYEISIEEVLVSNSWKSIEFEDVVEIVVLTMDISADGDFFIILDGVVDQRFVTAENVLALLDELKRETLVEGFLLLEALHQLDDPK